MIKQRRFWFLCVLGVTMALAALLAGARTAQALEVVEGGRIAAGDVIDDDVLISGNNIVIDGRVNGNVFAFGSTMTLNGRVGGSLFVFAQNVTINGEVIGSIYCGATTLELSPDASVGRNTVFAGFSVRTEANSSVGMDIVAVGYQALLSGKVTRDVDVAVQAFELSGRVGGDVKARVEAPGKVIPSFLPLAGIPPTVPSGLRVSSDAVVGGTFTYTSPVAQPDGIRATLEDVVYEAIAPVQVAEPARGVKPALGIGLWIVARMRQLITLFLFGLLVIYLLPKIFKQVVDKAKSQTLLSAGWGVVTVIGGYAAFFLAAWAILAVGLLLGMLTFGGLSQVVFGVGFLSLGLALALFVLLVTFGSKLVVLYLGGKSILQAIAPQNAGLDLLALVIGIALYVLLRAIPFLGWWVGAGVTLIGLGAMFLYVIQLRKRPPARRKAAR